jgi:hypothetical protein
VVPNESEAALGEKARLLRVVDSIIGFHGFGGDFGVADNTSKDTSEGVEKRVGHGLVIGKAIPQIPNVVGA